MVAQATIDLPVEVAYRTLDTPIGRLFVAASLRGVCRVAFESEDVDAVLDDLSERVMGFLVRDPSRLDQVASEIDQYLAGTRREFSVPVDLSLSTGFRAVVQGYLPTIGYGKTQTYREVAVGVGNPNAVRAVGSACAANPVPLIVPCHRVVRTGGGLGGYRGGLAAKRLLLDLEAGRRG